MAIPRERLRKHKFTDAELAVLIKEVTRQEDTLFGLQGNRLTTQEKYKIWFQITERVCTASGIQRSINDVKRRWQDLKRRTKAKVVDARRHTPGDSPSTSPSLYLSSMERKVFDSLNIHTVVKDEEPNTTASNLPEDLFLDAGLVSPETCQLSAEPQETPAKDHVFEEHPVPSALAVLHTEKSPPMPVSCPEVTIKSEAHSRYPFGHSAVTMDKVESPTIATMVSPCAGLRVPLRAQSVACSRKMVPLGSFEQQLLRAHREHTTALREGFRSLARQNRLLYREMCETNKNVSRIASRIAEKNESVSDVAEELMGIHHKITESIDATNCLQDRVIDLLASQQERPVIVLPNDRRDGRSASSVEEEGTVCRADP